MILVVSRSSRPASEVPQGLGLLKLLRSSRLLHHDRMDGDAARFVPRWIPASVTRQVLGQSRKSALEAQVDRGMERVVSN